MTIFETPPDLLAPVEQRTDGRGVGRLGADRLAPGEAAVAAGAAPAGQAGLVHRLAQVDAVQVLTRDSSRWNSSKPPVGSTVMARASRILARTQALACLAAEASAQQRASGTPWGA
jgi:hypothetical protein